MSQMTAMHVPDGASAPPDGQPLNGGAYQVQLQATADGKLLVSGISGGGGGSGDASAAKQDTQIARETEIRDRIGTTTDVAPANLSAAGTVIAWFRWCASALGTLGEAAAVSGSVLAMMRQAVARMPALGQTTMASSRPVALASDQPALPTKVATFAASASLTRPADTTAYAVGDAVSNSTGAPAVLQLTLPGAANGQSYVVTDVIVTSSVKGATLPQFTAILAAATFTATADNAALALDQATFEAVTTSFIALTEQNSTNARSRVAATGLNLVRSLAAGDTKLYATLKADNAYTPASGETLTLIVHGYLL